MLAEAPVLVQKVLASTTRRLFSTGVNGNQPASRDATNQIHSFKASQPLKVAGAYLCDYVLTDNGKLCGYCTAGSNQVHN